VALKLGARQISWGDWLGTFSRSKKDSWAEFEVARSFVRSLNLNSRSEWDDYYENNALPLTIPKTFWTVYKEDGFKSVQDFLGSQYAHANDRKWMSFKEAKRFVRTLNLKSQNEYKEYVKSPNSPKNLPSNPHKTYKKDWKSYPDFMGYVPKVGRKHFLGFNQARQFSRSLGLSKRADWQEYLKSGKRPQNIPAKPEKTYQKKGWIDYKDWLNEN